MFVAFGRCESDENQEETGPEDEGARTGHLGYRVIVEALQAGYRVRAAIRDLSKKDIILGASSIKKLSPGADLEFVAVPDMLVPGAYDEVIKGATYAIHVASPLANAAKDGDDMMKILIEPAVKGTINMLEAAQKSGSVKRVAITSSIAAIVAAQDPKTGIVFDREARTPFAPPPYANAFDGYSASKAKALQDAEAWVEEKKPNFDVVHLFPSFIIGPDELSQTAEDCFKGTNGIVLKPLTGADNGMFFGVSVHVNDVALAHVRALDEKVPGNQGYVTSVRETNWEDHFGIVAKEFPEAVASGKLANSGKISTVPSTIDPTKSEEVFGFTFQSYEQQVKDIVGHYLALL
ncbi:NAD(P)-binding protein [Amniculicola lignicola CBS 123094]|uniref:NAD(P)-binding protein n=1 Tax=Amniculicola lignicola CBS 123094 TaxID=1392246 RepID=A0A6A5X193_9PLEO|nr:NAD(P)-binding protein [Amniculicola lignicola CBS 123094]